MIKLMVNKKCHNCPQFMATNDTVWENDKPVHFVKCLNADTCREIRRYLLELMAMKEDKEARTEGFDQ